MKNRFISECVTVTGLPQDVAALVEKLSAGGMTLTLVNTNQLESRTVIVQGGGYAEHTFVTVAADGKNVPVNGSNFTVRLAPGSGGRLVIKMKRYTNEPTLAFPWNRAG